MNEFDFTKKMNCSCIIPCTRVQDSHVTGAVCREFNKILNFQKYTYVISLTL